MKHTKEKWQVSKGKCENFLRFTDNIVYIIENDQEHFAFVYGDRRGKAIAHQIAQDHNSHDGLVDFAKELADIFPEHSISEMDAADFKDRAYRIWTASQTAKNILFALAEAEKEVE